MLGIQQEDARIERGQESGQRGELDTEHLMRIEAQDAQQRFQFLANVSSVLSGSLDYETTLRRLSELLVPALADWCYIDITGEDGTIERMEAAHEDPALQGLMRQMLEDAGPPDPHSPGYVHVLETGQPHLVSHITDDTISARAPDQLFHTLISQLAPVSFLCVPLIARGRVIGALSLFSGRSGRHFSQSDVQFAQEIAWRAALAVDNARLYQLAATARKAEERARRQYEFLAGAGAVLASSLDYETTLSSVARLAVPEIADWCSVHLLGEDGKLQSLSVAHADAAKVDLAWELQRRYPVNLDDSVGIPAVLRSGETELVPVITDDMLVAGSPDEYLLRILRELGLKSAMTVALRARHRVLGAIQFVSAESGRVFNADDVALAEALAARAATAVDNARLYREAHRTASEQSAVLSQMADAVAITDREGRIVYANEAARRVATGDLGGLLEDYVDPYGVEMADGNKFPPGELPVRRALNGERVTDARWRVRLPSGESMVLAGSAVPVFGPEGELTGAVVTFRDITAQYVLERQKDDFLSAAAHDLKTPLTSIKGLAQMLLRRSRRGTVDSAQLVEALQRIDGTSTRMTAMINEMLDMARIQMDRPFDLDRRAVDLVELVRNVLQEFRHASDRHQLNLVTGFDEIVGLWDSARIERVLTNLITNAIKYSPVGGPITITAWREDESNEALFSVADRGIGIPAADQERIFERFQRARNVTHRMSGTGIGLAAARSIVEQHGGTISVSSQEEKGSVFIVRLPMGEAPSATLQ